MQKKLSIEQAETPEYKAFKDKFKPKLTTDDCYTPTEVYEAVKTWVLQKCPQVQDLRIVRPFYPEGDYTREDYTRAVVIDNPPFSILAEIKRFYLKRGIPFFLFAPSLTLLSSESQNLCSIVADAQVTYHNGAVVSTSFVSSLFGDLVLLTAPDLKEAIEIAQKEARSQKPKPPKYRYPTHVVTSALLTKHVARGLQLEIPRSEAHFTRALDHQRQHKKGIYGSGFLVSDRIATILEESLQKPLPVPPTQATTEWKLSDREKQIIQKLSE